MSRPVPCLAFSADAGWHFAEIDVDRLEAAEAEDQAGAPTVDELLAAYRENELAQQRIETVRRTQYAQLLAESMRRVPESPDHVTPGQRRRLRAVS